MAGQDDRLLGPVCLTRKPPENRRVLLGSVLGVLDLVGSGQVAGTSRNLESNEILKTVYEIQLRFKVVM